MDLPEVKDDFLQFNSMIFLYNSAIKEMKMRLDILNDEYKFVHQYTPIDHVKSRIKSLDSITAKLQRQGKSLTIDNIQNYIDDIAGIRICCTYETDIYSIIDMLTDQEDLEILKVKDYYQDPKASGYKSYHMIVTIPIRLSKQVIPTKVELQIRTVAMDTWSCLESRAESVYDDYMPEHIIKDLRECSEMIKVLEQKMLEVKEEIEDYKQS